MGFKPVTDPLTGQRPPGSFFQTELLPKHAHRSALSSDPARS